MTCNVCRAWVAQDERTLASQLSALRAWPESQPLCPRCKTRAWASSTEGLPPRSAETGVVIVVVATLVLAMVVLMTALLVVPAGRPS